MSDAAKGAQRVGAVQSRLAAKGYRTARISASGQRRGARRNERGLDGDLIALAPEHSGYPHLLVEVGGIGKRVEASLREMTEHGPLPGGFVPIVARLVDPKARGRVDGWRWYIANDDWYLTLDALLAALRLR